ncbi:MAG: response regulator [Deltaproteobacteria bacterium]|nr:response regulator [Deltaproteobacteria bacterium]
MQSKILIVDDEPNILDTLLRTLRSMRNERDISFATSVDEALKILRSSEFDLVISDISMPVKNGFDLLSGIRNTEYTKDIPVLMMTGLNEQGLKSRALDMGATDLLHKPFDREDLIARINSMLHLKKYQDEIKAQNALLEQKVRERTAELETARLELIWRLGKAAEYRDTDTGNHVIRVGYYSKVLAEALGMDRKFNDMIFLTSPLHDIGKIGIPDSILLKPGKLTDDEWAVMKQHCKIGADILRDDIGKREFFMDFRKGVCRGEPGEHSDPFIKMAANIALSHHERWNGKGYPNGLAKQDIPLESRIVSIADVYDSLSSARPYKPAYAEERVLMIMRNDIGSHFDPEIFEHFEKYLDVFIGIRGQYSDDQVESITDFFLDTWRQTNKYVTAFPG